MGSALKMLSWWYKVYVFVLSNLIVWMLHVIYGIRVSLGCVHMLHVAYVLRYIFCLELVLDCNKYIYNNNRTLPRGTLSLEV